MTKHIKGTVLDLLEEKLNEVMCEELSHIMCDEARELGIPLEVALALYFEIKVQLDLESWLDVMKDEQCKIN